MPLVKVPENMVFFTGNSPVELCVNFSVSGIDAAITDHFVMLFWGMADKTLYKFHNWNCFFHIFAIFVVAVMESDKIPIILIGSESGNYRTPKVVANIFDGCFWVTFVRLGIYVEPFFVLMVAAGFEGRTGLGFHFVNQGSAESIAEERVVKMVDIPPETVTAVTAFGDDAVNVGVSF